MIDALAPPNLQDTYWWPLVVILIFAILAFVPWEILAWMLIP
jgi:hypothetical protein